jgi:alpha 1,6-mannosyltransferase
MALLLEGGIYTDTDTAPVTPITEWGHPYTTRTDPLLSCLSKLLSPSQFSEDAGPLDEPSLILSVESDAIELKWDDWRDVGLVRAVQIVQWTMAVRPFLAVFGNFADCWCDRRGRVIRCLWMLSDGRYAKRKN